MKKDKIKIYLVIIVFIIAISIIGVTYAYFESGISNEGSSDVTFELSDTATLTFEKGSDLVIEAGGSNFGIDGDNLSSTTTASVTLTAKSNYSSIYYTYFEILENDFVYTTEEETPELMLVITRPDGSLVKEIDGLSYTTSGGVEGFDITIADGLYEIAVPTLISLDYTGGVESETLEWTFTLYFINLDTNQNENSLKTFNSEIILNTDDNYKKTQLLADIVLLNEGEYKTIAEAKESIESKNYLWGNLIEYDAGLYSKIDQTGNNSYFFAGNVIDNYVYFADFYWRIVRIDGDGNIKMIYAGKTVDATGGDLQIGTSAFNTTSSNTVYTGYVYTIGSYHGTSTDSTIKKYLESWYGNNLSNYVDYIAETKYCIDRDAIYGNSTSGSYLTSTNSTWLNYGASRRLNYSKTGPILTCNNQLDELNLKIGLISADEVSLVTGFEAYPSSSTNYTNYYLYGGGSHFCWTISPAHSYNGDQGNFVFDSVLSVYGYVNVSSYGVRPTISLNSTTLVSMGNGTSYDPYIIE